MERVRYSFGDRALPKYMSPHMAWSSKIFHVHVLPEFFDRDFAREAVIGAIEADDLGDQTLDERRSLGEDGLQNRLLPLEGHDIARIIISIGIARDVGDRLAGLTVGGNALGLERDPGTIARDNLTILRQHVDDLCLVTIGLSRRDVGGDDRVRTGAHGITPGVRLTRRCICPQPPRAATP